MPLFHRRLICAAEHLERRQKLDARRQQLLHEELGVVEPPAAAGAGTATPLVLSPSGSATASPPPNPALGRAAAERARLQRYDAALSELTTAKAELESMTAALTVRADDVFGRRRMRVKLTSGVPCLPGNFAESQRRSSAQKRQARKISRQTEDTNGDDPGLAGHGTTRAAAGPPGSGPGSGCGRHGTGAWCWC